MYRIAIVEDEELYASQLKEYIEKFAGESGYSFRITQFWDGDEIASGYQGNFDIILMDIEMSLMDGMTAAEEIRKLDGDVVIMFITNMTNYAIRGYEVDALDYVLKPVSYFAFSQKLDRAVSRVKKKSSDHLTLEVSAGIKKVPLEDLYYIESEGHKLTFHTTDGVVQIRGKISDYEKQLEGRGFFRSNKGYLVNLHYVDGVEDGSCLIGGEKLLISRARKSEFMTALNRILSKE